MLFVSLAAALILDALTGEPECLWRRSGHPVTWIGAAIAALDHALNRPSWSAPARRLAGAASLALLVAGAAAAGALLHVLLHRLGAPSLLEALLLALPASTLLAARSLHGHVAAAAGALETEGLAAGRTAVAKIAGRDPDALDAHGVARAAIESLAENASDGVMAPAFWFVLFGLPGLLVYKTVNTADSMIGHRTPRHEAFGWAAARLDDALNLVPARLTALLIAAAAALAPDGSAKGALRTVWRDAAKHTSPNAGWPESAMAGALGLKLAGPRVYGGKRLDAAFMGDGRAGATVADIRRALGLARAAWGVLLALVALAALSTLIPPGR